jgi:hypothetical protein
MLGIACALDSQRKNLIDTNKQALNKDHPHADDIKVFGSESKPCAAPPKTALAALKSHLAAAQRCGRQSSQRL